MMEKKMRCATLVLAAVALSFAACSEHYSTQEAYEVCDDLTERVHTTPEDSFAACVACYEDCGDDCQQVTAEEGHFVCPED